MGMSPIIVLAASVTENSIAETMKTALLNTVMGIMIVFLVLILISWLISLFKFISKAENAVKKKNNNVVVEKEKPAVTAPLPIKEENLVSDAELVAVITAAIYAYEESNGTPIAENGLYVRSIRKANKSRWQNA